MSFPRSDAKPHQINLQHHLLPCTAYTIIAKHKQIGIPVVLSKKKAKKAKKFSLGDKHPEPIISNSNESISSSNATTTASKPKKFSRRTRVDLDLESANPSGDKFSVPKDSKLSKT
ncbi:hypothetical protein DEO72_LG8g1452 [Vigna unguiculata]|uniref:Uncharacterized protein n=1 Tax=Vigna unguiculata TaxID=3917 RepID=A0A4D6MQU8_VIGUN|nr:hypothetical protein DEO72_LG8g1452 [Vigna unguiculata]